MQVFTPYDNPLDCAHALWNDKKRFNKQITECKQILDAIDGKTKWWANHPVTRMYKPYRNWLLYYACCLTAYKVWANDVNSTLYTAKLYSEKANAIRPPFLTKEFCDQHKRRLFTKAPQLYQEFSNYGTSEENWYVVDGKLVKYLNSKIVK